MTDAEAMEAFRLLCRTEGILPAIESAHALAGARQLGRELGARRHRARQPLRSRRQGRRHRRSLVRSGDRFVSTSLTMRSAVGASFATASEQGRAALIGYLPAGFPSVGGGIALMQAMVAGGVDAMEIGFPYSDPVMDGPTIQRASEIALRWDAHR